MEKELKKIHDWLGHRLNGNYNHRTTHSILKRKVNRLNFKQQFSKCDCYFPVIDNEIKDSYKVYD